MGWALGQWLFVPFEDHGMLIPVAYPEVLRVRSVTATPRLSTRGRVTMSKDILHPTLHVSLTRTGGAQRSRLLWARISSIPTHLSLTRTHQVHLSNRSCECSTQCYCRNINFENWNTVKYNQLFCWMKTNEGLSSNRRIHQSVRSGVLKFCAELQQKMHGAGGNVGGWVGWLEGWWVGWWVGWITMRNNILSLTSGLRSQPPPVSIVSLPPTLTPWCQSTSTSAVKI